MAIGDALAAGGHDVAWCGPETDLRPLVGPGAVIYPTGKRSYREFQQVGMAAVRELWDEYLLPLNRFIQDPVDHAVAGYRPDVIVADQVALAGALAACRSGVRWATLCTGVLELTSPQREPGLDDWVRSKLARVVAALEPLAGRVQAVINAATEAVPDPPPHVLVAPRVPMLELMPRLDAVICQAGQSTVNEALAHGVPLVVAPIRLGELVVAQQVERVGAGVAVSFFEAAPAQLTAAVTAVLDEPGYRGGARRAGEDYAAAGGTAAAAARLGALAQAGVRG